MGAKDHKYANIKRAYFGKDSKILVVMWISIVCIRTLQANFYKSLHCLEDIYSRIHRQGKELLLDPEHRIIYAKLR